MFKPWLTAAGNSFGANNKCLRFSNGGKASKRGKFYLFFDA